MNRICRDLLWLALVSVAGPWNLIAVCQGQVSDAAPAGVVVADQTVAALVGLGEGVGQIDDLIVELIESLMFGITAGV